MRRVKVFNIIQNLCGDVVHVALSASDPGTLYVETAFRCFDMAVDICGYVLERGNTAAALDNLKKETAVSIENFKKQLEKESDELKSQFQEEEYHTKVINEKHEITLNSIIQLSKKLKETIDIIDSLKSEMSLTEETVSENKVAISKLDEWLRTSTNNYYKMVEYYQIGGNE